MTPATLTPPSVAVLPSAPTDRDRVSYATARSSWLVGTQFAAWSGASLSLWLFARHSPWLWPFSVWVLFGLVYFGLSFLANTTFHRFDMAVHDHLVARFLAAGARPSVDVFLPN